MTRVTEALLNLEAVRLDKDQLPKASRKDALKVLMGKSLLCPESIAVHGTSLSSIKHLLSSGTIPTNLSSNSTGGKLYIAPLPRTLPANTDWECDIPTSDLDAVESAEIYAYILSQAGWLMSQLDIPYSRSDKLASCKELAVTAYAPLDSVIHDLADDEHDHLQIKSLLARMPKNRAGVVIAFNQNLYSKYKVETAPYEGPYYDEGFAVDAPRGIGLDCIAAIVPIGDYERTYLNSFLKSTS